MIVLTNTFIANIFFLLSIHNCLFLKYVRDQEGDIFLLYINTWHNDPDGSEHIVQKPDITIHPLTDIRFFIHTVIYIHKWLMNYNLMFVILCLTMNTGNAGASVLNDRDAPS